jgi:hypothetical protein
VSNGGRIKEKLIEKDFEGRSLGFIVVLSQPLLRQPEEDHNKCQ